MTEALIQDRCAIFISDLPNGLSRDKITRLHLAHGLAEPVDFQLLHHSPDSQANCAVFRYADAAAAERALEVLSGLPVEYNGKYWPLRVQPAGIKINPAPIQMPRQVELTKDAIIHVAQVPSEWSAEELRQLHQSLVIEEFQNVKIMPSSDGGITRHAYLQYRTAAAAWSAVKRLSGNLVHVSGGVRQLAAELSAPETQVSGPEPERYLNGNKPRPQAPQGPGAPVAPGPGGPGGSRVPKEKARSAFEPGPNHDPFTLYLSDMPSDFSKQDLDRLHDHLNLRKPKSIKVVFLRLKKGKSSAILRYETTEQAKEALTMLHDRVLLVNEHSGEEQHPRAQYAKRRASDAMYQEEEGSHAGSDHEEEAMYSLPSVYLAELPVNITDNGVRHILQEVGANLEDLVTITFLQQKNKGSHICCLLRYHNLETAEAVANLLHGFRVYHPDDRTRPVRAKVAKHAKNFNPVCTDVYLGEIPNTWTAASVHKFLHQAAGEGAAGGVTQIPDPGHSTSPCR
ncbi:unnamed protein product [Effrenium voratum]|uniref:RRM domain-containing protein n=1 Tax=Effrenium voratum TaxID=2562239 RepID=A0AA36N2L0_9DINO|nr:unnamed protein product [Effrenium voratum]